MDLKCDTCGTFVQSNTVLFLTPSGKVAHLCDSCATKRDVAALDAAECAESSRLDF